MSVLQSSRRGFLKGAGTLGAGLVLGVHLPVFARAEATVQGPAGEATYAPNAFIRIAPDDTVTVLVKHIEFGQGPYTGLTTLVAEELDADWSQMRAESAPADVERYRNLAMGIQGTGGSSAIANSFEQMRKTGAAARAMLVSAAASAWEVPEAQVHVSKGRLLHEASGRNAGFGEFADAAARLPVPTDITLKKAEDFTLIGTDLPKLDTEAKTTGAATYTLDLSRPGMLTVLVAHPPRFGARPQSVDSDEALRVTGVEAVKTIPQGVAVYARNFWAASRGRDALVIDWDESGAETRSTEELVKNYRARASEPGVDAEQRGDAKQALADAAQVVEAEFVFPYLAHAPMEPLDCVIEASAEGVETWFGSQVQTGDQQALAGVFGIEPGQVKIHTQLAGGSFGRRAQQRGQFAAEAGEVAKAWGDATPLKLMWTREDDIKGGFYRPLYVHRLRAGLDAEGAITAWDHTIVGQSIRGRPPGEVDGSSVEGAANMPYAVDHLRVGLVTTEVDVPVLWWRSVGSTHTAYATEVFLDQLLHSGGRDPVEGRLALLSDSRHRGVLEEVARMADWGAEVASGRARGVALHKSFGTYVAQIAEISRNDDGLPRVHKVWCAVDCGVAVNPDIIRAQMEGGIGYGLSAALFEEITLEEGRVQQSNFGGYRTLRINEMPEVQVSIIRSAQPPTGVGEPGLPPVAPAVANAWYRLTGEWVRRLPFARERA